MARRSAAEQLPHDVRVALERRLVESAFSGYTELVEWLAGQGFAISRSALHRHGALLERKLEAVRASTQAARMIAEATPDDADLRSSAVISLVQTEIFNTLVDLQEADAEDDPGERLKMMSRAAEGIATLSRASVGLKRWQAEVAARVQSAARDVERIARTGGLSEAAAAEIRAKILGITPS
jgi:hypothetical protein